MSAVSVRVSLIVLTKRDLHVKTRTTEIDFLLAEWPGSLPGALPFGRVWAHLASPLEGEIGWRNGHGGWL